MKKVLLFSLLSFSMAVVSPAQVFHKVVFGVGAGLDYGGFGAQVVYMHTPVFGVFGGLGYNLNLLGYNIGVQVKVPSEKRVTWYGTAMYGYNAMLEVEGYEGTTKTTYYGLSIGTGIEFKRKRNPESFWSLGLLLPFRDKSFKNVIDDLRLAGYSVKDPLPVGISVGYHFKVK